MKIRLILSLVFLLCGAGLSGCALCHGHEGSDGAAMQKYWDHSNMGF